MELGMDLQVPRAGVSKFGQVEKPLAQDAQQGVVRFRSRPGELVVDQRATISAHGGKAVIRPQRVHLLFGLHDGVNVVVHELGPAVAVIVANQVGAAEFVIAVNQRDRPA